MTRTALSSRTSSSSSLLRAIVAAWRRRRPGGRRASPARAPARTPRDRTHRTELAPPTVSIVVPALDEEDVIEAALVRLRDRFPECDLVVVDGGSTDRTAERAARHAQVVHRTGGRGPQMNAGAAACAGSVIWFVHVDADVDARALPALRAALADPRVVGGGCRLRFDRTGPALRWLQWTSNLRARHLHWIFGDQAMFVRRSVFDELGGFPDLPIMEDLEMSRRLHRRGRLVVLPAETTASARRFVEQGTVRMLVLMQYLKLLYFLGVDPETIRRRYVAARRRSSRGPAAPAGT